jgi:hypothetical protein
MATLKEVKALKYQFIKEFDTVLTNGGNTLSIGIGKENIEEASKSPTKDEEWTLEVRLINNNLKDTLPKFYHGVKVNTIVVGPIVAYKTIG